MGIYSKSCIEVMPTRETLMVLYLVLSRILSVEMFFWSMLEDTLFLHSGLTILVFGSCTCPNNFSV